MQDRCNLSALQRALGDSDSIPQQQVVLACNIGRHGAQQRVWGGIFLLLIGAAVATVQVTLAAHPLWRLAVWPFLFFGVGSILQARYKTCVMLALRNRVDLDDGEQVLLDQGTRSIVRQRAWYISFASLLLSLLGLGSLLLPPLLSGEWQPFGVDVHKWAAEKGIWR
eukprot:EG_transcript_24032